MLAFILLALVACDPDSGKPGDPPGDSPADTGEPGDSDGHTGRPDDSDSDDEDTAEPEAAGTCPEGWETDTGAPPNPSWTSCETAPSPSGAAWSGWTTVRTHEILAYGPTLVADLNGDGWQDLLTCSGWMGWIHGGRAGWLSEDWATTWSSIELPRTDLCDDFLASDLDGDADLDVVVLGRDTGDLEWLENVGGDLVAVHTILDGTATSFGPLAAGDLDQDGAVDLLAGADLYWGDGGGSFDATPTTLDPADEAVILPLLDDGGDVLVRSDGVWRSDTARALSQVAASPPAGCSPDEAPVHGPHPTADLNGDGHPDVVMGGALCLGDGTGALTYGGPIAGSGRSQPGIATTTLPSGASAGIWNLAFYDDNSECDRRDGDVHLVRYGADGVEQVADHWVPAQERFQAGGALWQDLDADGVDDLLVWERTGGNAFALRSDGEGGFLSPWAWRASGDLIWETTPADLDGDGYQDLVMIQDGNLLVFRNECGRSFSLYERLLTDERTGETLSFAGPGLQLDTDAGEEVLVSRYGTHHRIDLDGDEIVVSTPASAWLDYQDDLWARQLPDLNGDGVQELVDWGSEGAAADGTTVFVAGLSGDGDLSTAWTIGPTDTPGAALAIATGDVSGDGQDDLIVLDTDGVRVWTWTSAGLAMTISTDLAWLDGDTSDLRARSLVATDSDGDGDQDLWVTLRGAGVVRGLRNDGAGVMSLGADLPAPDDLADATAVTLRGLDDGGLAAWTRDETHRVRAWRLEGGAMVERVDDEKVSEAELIVRDIDGDGLIDLAAAAHDRGLVYWGTGD